MIEIIVNPIAVEFCRQRAEKLGELNNSIRKGAGNMVGYIGEWMAMEYLKGSEEHDTYDYDVMFKGIRIDVKTKACASTPKPHYSASVAGFNTEQDCDVYLFARVLEVNGRYPVGWLCGWLEKEEFYRRSLFRKRGEKNPENDYVYQADCWDMRIENLKMMHRIVEEETR